jgi:hypothetical protein
LCLTSRSPAEVADLRLMTRMTTSSGEARESRAPPLDNKPDK